MLLPLNLKQLIWKRFRRLMNDKNKTERMRTIFYLVTGIVFLFTACVSPEKLRKEQVYFNEGLDTSKLGSYALVEPVIQKGDLLEISIISKSSASNQIFNYSYSSTVNPAPASIGDPIGAKGFMVDINTGEIKLPLLGIIQASGITKKQLEAEIIHRATEYLKEDPIVNIRFLNFRITFLGRVKLPGSKIYNSERVSFLDALGEVGGIEPGGDLKKILLFREQNGKREVHEIDLTNGSIFNSPFYYLRQNDVVYVSPTKRQIKNSDPANARTLQFASIGVAMLNLIVILTRAL